MLRKHRIKQRRQKWETVVYFQLISRTELLVSVLPDHLGYKHSSCNSCSVTYNLDYFFHCRKKKFLYMATTAINSTTVQPKNNARAGNTQDVLTPHVQEPHASERKKWKCGVLRFISKKFWKQEVEYLSARSRKKLRVHPQAARIKEKQEVVESRRLKF